MSNGIKPYQVAGSQQSLINSILEAQAAIQKGESKKKIQMGFMSKEFQDAVTTAEEEATAQLKKRKKGWFEKAFGFKATDALPLLGLIPAVGPMIGALLAGGSAVHELNEAERQAKWNIRAAKKGVAENLDPKWGKTFVSSPYKKITSAYDKSFEEMMGLADVGGMDLLTSGLMGGIQGYALGELGQGLKAAGTAAKATSTTQGILTEGMSKADIASLMPGELNRFASLSKTPGLRAFGASLKDTLGGSSALGVLSDENKSLLKNLLLLLQAGQSIKRT